MSWLDIKCVSNGNAARFFTPRSMVIDKAQTKSLHLKHGILVHNYEGELNGPNSVTETVLEMNQPLT